MQPRQIRYTPKEVPGRGWTVVKRIGSKRTGRTEESVDVTDTYTMHQAQMAADSMNRDLARHGA